MRMLTTGSSIRGIRPAIAYPIPTPRSHRTPPQHLTHARRLPIPLTDALKPRRRGLRQRRNATTLRLMVDVFQARSMEAGAELA
jgi:hypothetical protein